MFAQPLCGGANKKMGEVVELGVRFRGRHARASNSRRKKSSAVTAPQVSAAIRSATSREGQPLPSQSCVIQPEVTPIRCANSARLIPLRSRYSESLMEAIFSPAKDEAQEKPLASLHGQTPLASRILSMAKAKQNQSVKVQTRFKEPPFRPTFIKQWRLHRGLSQERLGDRIGLSGASVSQIENGKQGYSQENLEAIAQALRIDVVDLLIRDPSDPEGIWSLWDRAAPAQRKQIVGIIEGFLKTANG
jgi:transcriptional regulator with XRE-family HTH domain